jgi:uncharacterized protein (TIGR03435 family)
MKRLILCVVAFAALSGGALFAQDITGTWQGTLSAGRDLRTVIKIAKDDANGGALRATFYSIDQGPGALPGNVTMQSGNVKIALPGIGGTFEGKLEADATTITGTWTQGPRPLPLTLKKATPETAWAIPEPPPPPKRMDPNANPSFEVATIKPSRPDAPGKAIRVAGRQFSTLNTTLSDLITFAYGLHARQITNAPAWIETEKYDLAGQPDVDGQPNDQQLKSMVQKLLADRFKLKFHHDKKELNVYAITVDKGGHKLTKSNGDPNGLPALFFRGLGNFPVRNATMADFAGALQGAVLDRPVVDQTGLTGRWDFALLWTPDEFQFGGRGAQAPPPPATNGVTPPDLFTAFREQLGLKLDSTKAPADVLVIDSVEKPSPN